MSVSTLDKTKITRWTSSMPRMWEFGGFASEYPVKEKNKRDLKCFSLLHFSSFHSNFSVFGMERVSIMKQEIR